MRGGLFIWTFEIQKDKRRQGGHGRTTEKESASDNLGRAHFVKGRRRKKFSSAAREGKGRGVRDSIAKGYPKGWRRGRCKKPRSNCLLAACGGWSVTQGARSRKGGESTKHGGGGKKAYLTSIGRIATKQKLPAKESLKT